MGEWISVKDKLPESGGRYLCYYGFHQERSKHMMFMGVLDYFYFDPEPHWQHQGMGLFVTHWMPLPEPPKEES